MFQKQVNTQQAPAVAGDFASNNPTASALSIEAKLTAGAAGVTVGRIGWADASGIVTNAKGSKVQYGFVPRVQGTALIQSILAESTMLITEGMPVTLLTQGDFWGAFAAGATQGQKVFASDTDGTLSAAAAGATVAGSTETKFFVATTCLSGELAKISSWGI